MLSLLAMIVTTGSISIEFVAPVSAAPVTGEVEVQVRIRSQLLIQEAKAELGGRTVTLLPAQQLEMFSGKLGTDGLPRGTVVLKVTARDTQGLEAFNAIEIVLDEPPVLEVTEPAVDLVARGNFTVRARCFERSSGCHLTVRIEDPLRPLADRKVASIEGDEAVALPFCVAGYDGRRLDVQITATDAVQLTSRATRHVFVELSEALTPKIVAPGRILDVSGSRLLYRAENLAAFLSDGAEARRLGPTDLACSCFGSGCDDCRDFGRLVETGAIIHSPIGPRLLESNGPVSEDLGPYRPNRAVVRGHYAVWNDGEAMVRRDLRLGLNETVGLGAVFGDVDPETGVLVFKSGSVVCRLDAPDGGCNAVTNGALFGDPLIDGDDIAVQLHPNIIDLFTDAGRVRFTDSDRPVLRGGWLAFAQNGQVKLRRPDGGPVLVAGDAGSPEVLAPNGELTWLRDDGRRMLFVPERGESREISSGLGRPLWDGEWALLIGNTRFAVVADAGVGAGKVECPGTMPGPTPLGPVVPCSCSSGGAGLALVALAFAAKRRRTAR